MVRLVLSRGADMGAADANGSLPLHAAAHLGNPAVLEQLIEAFKSRDQYKKEEGEVSMF